MKLILIPQRRDDTLALSKSGDVLTINGAALDLSGIPDGATLPHGAVGSEWIAGPISRLGGVLQVPLLLPHGPIPYPALPEAAVMTHPQPITVTADGPIALPVWAEPEPVQEPEIEEPTDA